MENIQLLITRMYAAFNRRDIEGALELMSETVDWPKASEGGRVIGKEEVRAYWTRQWAEFDPRVDPIEITDRGRGKIDVRVHQLVRDWAAKSSPTRSWYTGTPSPMASSNAWTSTRANLRLESGKRGEGVPIRCPHCDV